MIKNQEVLQFVTIENSKVKASINLLGAELIEWTSKDSEVNSLWIGTGWPNTAPILFPIVGNLAQNTYRYKGKEYYLSRHGFVRNSMFKLLELRTDQAILELTDSEDTRTIYPFNFRFTVIFTLENDKLIIRYQVTNTGQNTMLFSLGSHPAFTHTRGASLEFEYLTMPFEGNNGFIDFTKKSHVKWENNTINIDDYDFSQGPIYFRDIPSQTIQLKNTHTAISMSIPNVPFLGIWKKPGCDFICIEPWYGITSRKSDKIEQLEDKMGILSLAINKSFSTEYQLQVSTFCV